MIGYYYLHTNGDLIFKHVSVVESDPSYFDSPFVKTHWYFNSEQRFDAWRICIEALALGTNKNRVFELKRKWGLTDEDAEKFAEVSKLKLFKKFGQYCAAFHDFKNMQESQTGFGLTALEAFADLAKGGLIP